MYEGLETEVCVAVLDRELTNDEERVFTVATSQLNDTQYTASRNIQFVGLRTINLLMW